LSRLFEALSTLTSEAPPKGQADSTAAAPSVVGSTAPRQGTEAKAPSARVVPLTIGPLAMAPAESEQEVETIDEAIEERTWNTKTRGVSVRALPESRLVALTDPDSLGAEKFRALVTRFNHLRKKQEFKSFQITSSVIDEGKTMVAGNVALTLAKYSDSKTLLVEGDLHRPTLASLLGLDDLRGLNHWWSSGGQDLGRFMYKLEDMPLWFLPAGKPCDRPSDLLRSARFSKAFAQLTSQFEWIVVDSTPMLPVVDVNLWSALVDGTLLVVREGVTPVKALKRGLRALDHPKLIGIVVNDATEFDQVSYDGQYYGGYTRRKKRV
jgi:capsular exopolysaccharide synthesis family protein